MNSNCAAEKHEPMNYFPQLKRQIRRLRERTLREGRLVEILDEKCGSNQSVCDRFTVHLPYCEHFVQLDVLFNVWDIEKPPDLIPVSLVNTNQVHFTSEILHYYDVLNPDNMPTLLNWDIHNPDHLYDLLLTDVFMALQKHYCKRLLTYLSETKTMNLDNVHQILNRKDVETLVMDDPNTNNNTKPSPPPMVMIWIPLFSSKNKETNNSVLETLPSDLSPSWFATVPPYSFHGEKLHLRCLRNLSDNCNDKFQVNLVIPKSMEFSSQIVRFSAITQKPLVEIVQECEKTFLACWELRRNFFNALQLEFTIIEYDAIDFSKFHVLVRTSMEDHSLLHLVLFQFTNQDSSSRLRMNDVLMPNLSLFLLDGDHKILLADQVLSQVIGNLNCSLNVIGKEYRSFLYSKLKTYNLEIWHKTTT